MSTGPPGITHNDIQAMVNALLAASRVLVLITTRTLAQIDDSITLPQLRALVVLERAGPLSHSALAAELDVQPSTAMRMVERLAAAGWVAIGASPNDKRASSILLTRKGERCVRQIMEDRSARLAEIAQRMPDCDFRDLIRTLESFARAGGECPVAVGHSF